MQRLTSLPIMSVIVMTAIAMGACSRSDTSSSTTSPSTTALTATTFAVPVTPTSAQPAPTQSLAVDTTAVVTSVDTTVVSPTSTALPEDQLVRFLAAVETVLEGTALEGVVYNDPEVYIAIAQAACASFTAGESFDDVSRDLLAELGSSKPDDDNRLVGAILGAATNTICAEHANLV